MPQNLSYISFLRIFATLAVVLIHASTGYLNSPFIDSFDWKYANSLHSFTRLAVPLFVMISGALLIPKEESPMVFYRKRLLPILPIFLFWTGVYLVYMLSRYTSLSDYSYVQLWAIIGPKLRIGTNAHLWYLYLLVGLYLAIPYLHKLVKGCSKVDLELFLGIWFISLFFHNKRWSPHMPIIDLGFFTGYFGYLVLGYYLMAYDIGLNIKRGISSRWSVVMVLLLLYLATAIFTTLSTYYLSIQKHGLDALLYGYTAPNTALSAAAIFLIFKYTFQHVKVPRILSYVNTYSFGIYLSHILFLNYIHPLLPLSTLWKIPVATLLTVLASILLTALLHKIPFGKQLAG